MELEAKILFSPLHTYLTLEWKEADYVSMTILLNFKEHVPHEGRHSLGCWISPFTLRVTVVCNHV